ncbi:hypothetical protein, partial [Coprobacter tertius]|uniref:hypothetical protein n=1 Tax=Coprobacter tertius TaxID=2944915 RepID=UPI003F497E1B
MSSETANNQKYTGTHPLYFAFKMLSLCDQKQLDYTGEKLFVVVFCFQNVIFVSSETANNQKYTGTHPLYFAFKMLSLCDQKQL